MNTLSVVNYAYINAYVNNLTSITINLSARTHTHVSSWKLTENMKTLSCSGINKCLEFIKLF